MSERRSESKQKQQQPKTIAVSCSQLDRHSHVAWYPGTSDKAMELAIFTALEISSAEQQNALFCESKDYRAFFNIFGDDEHLDAVVHLAINEFLPDDIAIEVILPERNENGLIRASIDTTSDEVSLLRDDGQVGEGSEDQPLLQSRSSDTRKQDSEVRERKVFRVQLLKFNRINSHLANERTWLAWARTAMSILSIAFTLYSQASDASYKGWKVSWMFFGCLLIIISDINWFLGWSRYARVKEICSIESTEEAEKVMTHDFLGLTSLKGLTYSSGAVLTGILILYWWYGFVQSF